MKNHNLLLIIFINFYLLTAIFFTNNLFAQEDAASASTEQVTPAATGNKEESAPQAQERKGSTSSLQTRIDFGNSFIMGQTIKSGAVYLLQRKQSEIKSMLKYRKNYRKEILEDFHIAKKEKKEPKKEIPNKK